MGKSSKHGPFSMAMLNNQMVYTSIQDVFQHVERILPNSPWIYCNLFPTETHPFAVRFAGNVRLKLAHKVIGRIKWWFKPDIYHPPTVILKLINEL